MEIKGPLIILWVLRSGRSRPVPGGSSCRSANRVRAEGAGGAPRAPRLAQTCVSQAVSPGLPLKRTTAPALEPDEGQVPPPRWPGGCRGPSRSSSSFARFAGEETETQSGEGTRWGPYGWGWGRAAGDGGTSSGWEAGAGEGSLRGWVGVGWGRGWVDPGAWREKLG